MVRDRSWIELLGAKAIRRKSLTEAQSLDTPLNRCLSVWHLTFFGVAHMAGAGIYVLSGTVIKEYAGPAASLSFTLCAIASLFTGMCYVEFASLVPKAGSSYTYTYCVLGELPAFIVGWTMLLDYILSMATVAKAFSGTVDSLSKQKISNFVSANLGTLPKAWSIFDETWDLLAVGLILVLALLLIGGAKFSMSVNAGLSTAQLLCLLTATVACFVYGSLDNWTAGSGFFPFGGVGVVEGASIAMFAFSGFESVGSAAEECSNPKRDLPRALLASLSAVSVVYVVACLGLSFLQPYWKLNVAAPFVVAFSGHPGAKWAEVTAAVGTLLATGATKVTGLFVVPRLMYALASDGVIFGAFANVNERVQVPLLGLAFGAVVSSVLALLFRLNFLAEMVSMGTLVSYCFIGVDLFVLRYLHFAELPGDSPVQLRAWAANGILARCVPGLARVRWLRRLFLAFLLGCVWLATTLSVIIKGTQLWRWAFLAPPGLALIFSGALLTAFKPYDVPGMYMSPGLPLAPLLAVLINVLLLSRLSIRSWIRFFCWLFLGLLMYILYGVKHSKAKSVDDYPDSNQDKAVKDSRPDVTGDQLADTPAADKDKTTSEPENEEKKESET
ncbi:hypothetical protein BOX15_Mlig005674g2 [Macrostomum lignano]|uniref:Cationic amino acid transporter C-terminal domain-containing protein n=1 Tax=Macrostomum lignano TaxID=282301 RepID=A0A267GSN9_9PLAT|nr:hypothetical protein BOX15_Mlig005674g2 [Macrostomum lignano]